MMNAQRSYWVYMLASGLGGTLYIGVTNDLARRVDEHRSGAAEGFTRRHGVHRLVYFEPHEQIAFALQREKQLKKWRRAWKVAQIEQENPDWSDLYPAITRP